MSAVASVSAPVPVTPAMGVREVARDGREARAIPRIDRFVPLTAQLGLVLFVFRIYRLEEPAFFVLSSIAFAGFAVHYWLPFRFKEPFWILLSLASAYVLLEPLTASVLIGAGLVLFGVAASPLRYAARAATIAAIFLAIMAARWRGLGFIPPRFWAVFGAIFMFRLIVYVYTLRHMSGRPKFSEYLSYFFLLPNYYFLLFPVVDFQTLRRSYFQRDIHDVAQQGVTWIVRGTLHLLLYRLIYQWKPVNTPDNVTTFGTLVAAIVTTYLLYLRVSGHFHIIAGLLNLYGYDVPETHRKYFLARSITDFWRRINIYWKDFMVKIVYFPVYFHLRRRGDLRAKVAATSAVFAATWAFHSYQWFWLRGSFLFSWPDVLFWAILGAAVIVNTLMESRGRQAAAARGPSRVRLAAQTVATFSVLAVLWSLWNSPTLGEWADLITWWRIS